MKFLKSAKITYLIWNVFFKKFRTKTLVFCWVIMKLSASYFCKEFCFHHLSTKPQTKGAQSFEISGNEGRGVAKLLMVEKCFDPNMQKVNTFWHENEYLYKLHSWLARKFFFEEVFFCFHSNKRCIFTKHTMWYCIENPYTSCKNACVIFRCCCLSSEIFCNNNTLSPLQCLTWIHNIRDRSNNWVQLLSGWNVSNSSKSWTVIFKIGQIADEKRICIYGSFN